MAVFPWLLIRLMSSNAARFSSLESEAFDICWTAAGESGQQSREFWDSYVQLKCQEACCTQSYLYNWKERGEELQDQSMLVNVEGWRVGYVGEGVGVGQVMQKHESSSGSVIHCVSE